MKPSTSAVSPNGIGLVKGLPARPDITHSAGENRISTDQKQAPSAPATQPHWNGRSRSAGTAASSRKIGTDSSSRDGESKARDGTSPVSSACRPIASG